MFTVWMLAFHAIDGIVASDTSPNAAGTTRGWQDLLDEGDKEGR
jgi:hypothetical protein